MSIKKDQYPATFVITIGTLPNCLTCDLRLSGIVDDEFTEALAIAIEPIAQRLFNARFPQNKQNSPPTVTGPKL